MCADAACFAQVRKRRMFDARLRVKVSADDYERLEAELGALCEMREAAQ